MHATIAQLTELVGGTCLGDGQTCITGANPLADARPGEITLVDHLDRLPKLANSQASAVVVVAAAGPQRIPTIAVTDVHAAFAKIVRHFRPDRARPPAGVSPAACVADTAVLGQGTVVHPRAVIGDQVTIGRDCEIHPGACIMAGSTLGDRVRVFPNAVLYPDTKVGNDCTIHAGAVLGADGFGYRQTHGRHEPISQLGQVVLEDCVDIGAGTTVDRGTYGPTTIGQGTKIDNLVQIAHNCKIGRHNLICSQVGIAGSTSTGDYVVMAGQVGVRDHVHIGDRSVLCAQAGIHNDIPPDVQMLGSPATELRDQRQCMIAYSRLPEMRKRLKELERTLAEAETARNQPPVENGRPSKAA